MIPVSAAREVFDDLRPLSRPLQHAALSVMRELRHDPYRGQRLLWTLGAKRLSCRAVDFDLPDDELWRVGFFIARTRPPLGRRYRIVYELFVADATPTHIRVLAVGAKLPAGGEDLLETAHERSD